MIQLYESLDNAIVSEIFLLAGIMAVDSHEKQCLLGSSLCYATTWSMILDNSLHLSATVSFTFLCLLRLTLLTEELSLMLIKHLA